MKVFKILGGILLVILLLLILLPFIFQGKIAEEIQKAMDDNLNARVVIGNVDLSLISSFPSFGLEINDIQVAGKGIYEGVELGKIRSIETKLDLMSVINGDQIKINKLGISDAYFVVHVNSDTIANYDIIKTSGEIGIETELKETEVETESAFSMAVEEYFLKNINVEYTNKPGDIYAKIENLTHTGSGDMTTDIFNFATQTNIDLLTVKSGGVKYLNQAKLDVKLDIGVDIPNSKYTFNKNHFGINDLMLKFDGFIAIPDDETPELDLTFSTEKSTFKSILSLLPEVYMTDFESVKTSGDFALSGMAKGKLKGDDFPAFNLDLKVNNGRFQYPDLPKAGENINIDLKVKNPGGSDDNTIVNLKVFHIELAGNPIDLKAKVTTPVSDANIAARLMADIDLSTLNDVIPSESGEKYTGKINADITMKGRISTLEAEDYENFDAKGFMIMEGITYRDSSLDYDVVVNKMDFQFTPKSIEMTELNCQLGKTDINGSGIVSNFLPYYFNDSKLSGKLNLNSSLMDLDELAGSEEESVTADSESTTTGSEEKTENDTSSAASGVEEIPSNIDFEMNTNFKKLLYDGIEIADMIGKITIRNQKLSMDNLDMKMLEGSMNMSGYYETTNPVNPKVDFNVDINDFDIPKTFSTFNTAEKMAPIGKNALGKFSTDMKLVCTLDGNMELISESITGGGNFNTKEVRIKDSKTLTQMAGLLKNDNLKDPKIEDVNISYEFRDGRVYVKPFDIKMAGFKMNIEGSNGFDNTLDYIVKTKIPMSALGDANKLAQGLLGEINKAAGTNVKTNETFDVTLRISGTSDNPKIKSSLGALDGGKGNIDKFTKEKAKEELNKMKEEAAKKAREEVDKLKKQAEDSIRIEAAKIQKLAEDSIRDEADRLMKELEKEAKKEAEKAAGDIGKEAKKAIEGLFKKR